MLPNEILPTPEQETPNQTQGIGVPVDVIINYLTDLHRQLDAITFNLRSNITNLQGEAKNASSTKE